MYIISESLFTNSNQQRRYNLFLLTFTNKIIFKKGKQTLNLIRDGAYEKCGDSSLLSPKMGLGPARVPKSQSPSRVRAEVSEQASKQAMTYSAWRVHAQSLPRSLRP